MFLKDIDEMDDDAENFYIKFQTIHRDKYLANKAKQMDNQNLENFK